MIEPRDPSTLATRVIARSAHPGSRGRLRGSRRKAVLTVPIAAALSLLGASTVLLVGGLHAATRGDPQAAQAVYRLLRLLTFTVDIPLAIITLIAGLVLALTSPWRILGDRWLTTKLIPLPRDRDARALLGPSIDTMLDVTETPGPSEIGTRWRPIVLPGMQAAMLTAAATLGVFKPDRRARQAEGENRN
jgi:hypothetical protein